MSPTAVAGQGGPRVLLIGMMAVGKSTVGLAVAGLTGWPYRDNDVAFEAVDGRSAAEVLESDGVEALRGAEAAVLLGVLAEPGPLVAGAAGGTIEDPDLRRKMRDGAFVVHLRAPISLLAERIERDSTARRASGAAPRPWVDDDPVRALEQLHRSRGHLYADTAHLVIDVAGREPMAIAREIVDVVSSSGGGVVPI